MKVMHGIEKFIGAVGVVAGVIIAALASMICVDIVMRYFFLSSITGNVEIIISSVPVIAFLSVGYTMLKEMHIRVDVVKKWPILDRVMNTVCVVFLLIIGYYIAVYAMGVKDIGTVTALLKIPRWPLVLVTSFGMFMVALALIVNEIKRYIQFFADRKKGVLPLEAETIALTPEEAAEAKMEEMEKK